MRHAARRAETYCEIGLTQDNRVRVDTEFGKFVLTPDKARILVKQLRDVRTDLFPAWEVSAVTGPICDGIEEFAEMAEVLQAGGGIA
jgi:hypothetical protein